MSRFNFVFEERAQRPRFPIRFPRREASESHEFRPPRLEKLMTKRFQRFQRGSRSESSTSSERFPRRKSPLQATVYKPKQLPTDFVGKTERISECPDAPSPWARLYHKLKNKAEMHAKSKMWHEIGMAKLNAGKGGKKCLERNSSEESSFFSASFYTSSDLWSSPSSDSESSSAPQATVCKPQKLPTDFNGKTERISDCPNAPSPWARLYHTKKHNEMHAKAKISMWYEIGMEKLNAGKRGLAKKDLEKKSEESMSRSSEETYSWASSEASVTPETTELLLPPRPPRISRHAGAPSSRDWAMLLSGSQEL